MNPAVFLDRDGTLLAPVKHIFCPEHTAPRNPGDIRLLPGIPEGLRLLGHCCLVVVTNQSGVARGLYSNEMLATINATVTLLLQDQGIGNLLGWYCCPHLPGEGCDCRKPGTKLFYDAALDLRLDLSTSWVIGDDKADIIAGRAVGARTILTWATKKSLAACEDTLIQPDFIANTFLEGCQFLASKTGHLQA